MEVRGQLNAQ